MQNSMMLLTFFVFDWKYPFWANLVQKIKIISLSWKLVLTLIQNWVSNAELSGHVHFFCFWSEIHSLGKFDPKNQNYQFKLKFGTYTNSNMKNSMACSLFSFLIRNIFFGANLVQKVKIINLSWDLVASLIWISSIQWCCSLFLFSNGNTLFGQI